MGKSVTLADPGKHIGGMTSGGLGWVDYGNKQAIGGISREFIDRVLKHYAGIPKTEWAQGEGWTFEPHVAEDIFFNMLDETKVPVRFGEELASVKKEGTRITEITMANGHVYRAKMFIDATYEGDLMARAHVSYAQNREANSQYNETLNGVRREAPTGLGAKLRVDPYVKPGDPASGLLPLIQPDPPGKDGDADAIAVQAYNYRLCLTRNPANRMPIDPPPDYDPARYELVARSIAAAQAQGMTIDLTRKPNDPWRTTANFRLLKIDKLPNGKTDVNNGGWVSTDYVGYGANYASADSATRRKIEKDHENYMRGFLHFIATDPRVPENVRAAMQEWGLCRDEFMDTDGWPFQLYVREARRMVGGYVMTEHDCRRETAFDDSVGLGSYAMDSHSFRRIAHDGIVINEGGNMEYLKTPYPITYRAIIPQEKECVNLLVPACCSASHAAYASLRMEPVFMILGQSAATAASIAIDDKIPLQKVDIKKLQARLIADKQLLDPPPPPVTPPK